MKRINRKSQRKPRQTSRRVSEHAKLKSYLKKTTPDVLGYLEAILSDTFQRLSHYRQADYSRDVATLRRRYASEGLSFATKTLPDLFNSFLQVLEGGKPSYPSFRIVRGASYPVFLRQLFAMVSECRDERACTESMQCLYQLCHAFKKLRGPYKPSTLQKQLWSFVEDDIDLRYVDPLSEPCFPILIKAKDIVTKIFSGSSPEFDPMTFVPTPGPGATNTPRRKNVRYRPHVLYKQLDDVFPYEDWFYSHPWDVVTGSAGFKALRRNCAPSSRFKFVPKTYGKPRGICIEELETQYLQQAIKRHMYHLMETHPLTAGYVNFTDQSVNRELALQSSLTQSFATLDMSSASDRVSRKLVRYLFKDCPDMWAALDATSTRNIELPKEVAIDFLDTLPCAKFAPMGSATCFPVMALVHYALIKAILELSSIPKYLARDVYVYGDDIIVNSACVDAVYAYLPLFGMKFNAEKSYVHSQFRESCGMHAYKGVEITPEYFKYIPHRNSSRDVALSLLSLEARLFQKGFKRTAALVRSKLLKMSCLANQRVWPYVTPKSPVLGFIREDSDAPRCRYNGLPRRYSKNLHCFEVYCLVATPSGEALTIDADNEAYLHWLCDKGIQRTDNDRVAREYQKVYPYDRKVAARRFAFASHAQASCCLKPGQKTSKGANVVSDSSFDPPWIKAKWCPESAL